MKKILLLCGMLLALTATVASAAGVNLSWDNCGAAGTPSKSFACNTNTGSAVFVASVSAPAGIGLWTSFETEIQVQSNGAWPAWWALRNQTGQTGQCRAGALSVSQDFTGGPYAGVCGDTFLNQGAGGITTYLVGFNGPNRARLAVTFSVPSANQVPLDEGFEYFSMRGAILYTKTVGTGACAGCQDGVCLNCTYVRCLQPAGAPGGNVSVTNPAGRSYIMWNGATVEACNGATPTKSTTWGSVKALYR
jgi:hypothetical protein